MEIKTISIPGESHSMIEDFQVVRVQGRSVVACVGDWANNLDGGKYQHLEVAQRLGLPEDTMFGGGVIGSVLASEVVARSDKTGWELLEEVTSRIRRAYDEVGLEGVESDRSKSFTGYIAHVNVDSDKAIVTAVGDVRLACDGQVIAGKTKKIDTKNNQRRAEFIRETGKENSNDGYLHVRPHIISQYAFQNTPGNEFTYPAIDGTKILPRGDVQIFEVSRPKKILLWSDGYVTPDDGEEFSIKGLEKMLDKVKRVDPYRYKTYQAVGFLQDDRTAVEIYLD